MWHNRSGRVDSPSKRSELQMMVRVQFVADGWGFRLSQMILDKVFHGVLDQGRGCLIVYDNPESDVSCLGLGTPHRLLTCIFFSQNTYGAAIETLEQVGKVVDSLYAKVRNRLVAVSGLRLTRLFCRR